MKKQDRPVYFEGIGFQDVPIYERKWMPIGTTVEGPAVIEEEFSSTVLIPATTAAIDDYNNIIITIV